MAKIVLIGAYPESLVYFRGELIKSMIAKGHHVVTMAAPAEAEIVERIIACGAEFIPYPVERSGVNPLKDAQTFLFLKKELSRIEPDVVLAYTIKPVIWGGLACRAVSGTRFYAMIEGLGFSFNSDTRLRTMLKALVIKMYRLSLLNAEKIFFLNKDDPIVFLSHKIVSSNKCVHIDGIGIDLNHFKATGFPERPIVFLSIARLLNQKGIRIYAEAASLVKKRYPDVLFRLLGIPDQSPDGIPIEEIQKWHDTKCIEYLGVTDDVRPYLGSCHVFVLASFYGEGLPRTIMEAMSTGRPILTTDNVGCRETVMPGQNGFLVSPKDAKGLAERMIWFVEHPDAIVHMGKISRFIAEHRFDVKKINCEICTIMGIGNSTDG